MYQIRLLFLIIYAVILKPVKTQNAGSQLLAHRETIRTDIITFDDVQQNMQLVGCDLLQMIPTSYLDCLIQCTIHHQCRSVNYYESGENDGKMICEFNSLTRTDVKDSMIRRRQWNYIGTHDETKDLPPTSKSCSGCIDCTQITSPCEFPTECKNITELPGHACITKDLLSASYQSLQHSSDYNTPDRAVDNNPTTCSAVPLLFNTIDYPKWQIDFKEALMVEGVVVHNPGNCCPEDLSNAEILLVTDSYDFPCGSVGDMKNIQVKTVICLQSRRAKAVRIERETRFLTLCEVEIYGHF